MDDKIDFLSMAAAQAALVMCADDPIREAERITENFPGPIDGNTLLSLAHNTLAARARKRPTN